MDGQPGSALFSLPVQTAGFTPFLRYIPLLAHLPGQANLERSEPENT